jgi:hypothetical protein
VSKSCITRPPLPVQYLAWRAINDTTNTASGCRSCVGAAWPAVFRTQCICVSSQSCEMHSCAWHHAGCLSGTTTTPSKLKYITIEA